jgi:hypothetical protein
MRKITCALLGLVAVGCGGSNSFSAISAEFAKPTGQVSAATTGSDLAAAMQNAAEQSSVTGIIPIAPRPRSPIHVMATDFCPGLATSVQGGGGNFSCPCPSGGTLSGSANVESQSASGGVATVSIHLAACSFATGTPMESVTGDVSAQITATTTGGSNPSSSSTIIEDANLMVTIGSMAQTISIADVITITSNPDAFTTWVRYDRGDKTFVWFGNLTAQGFEIKGANGTFTCTITSTAGTTPVTGSCTDGGSNTFTF